MGTREEIIEIPAELKPEDGRFGCGPSKIRPEAIDALEAWSTVSLGTESAVQEQTLRFKEGLQELFQLPDDWDILIGNGGASFFWDAAAYGLIQNRSQHLVFGEFSAKFASIVQSAPFLDNPEIIESEVGTCPSAQANPDVDVYAFTQNETSTGVVMEIVRPAGEGLVVVDATSAAGAVVCDPSEFDVYYFAPQKCFASDGGIWVALCSPVTTERIDQIAAVRYVPASLSLHSPLDVHSALTLFLAAEQTD